MNNFENVFHNNIRLIITVLAVFILTSTSGCVLVRDPIMHAEVYEGVSSDINRFTVSLRALRYGSEYTSGPKVRFIDDKGVIWELSLISNDPEYWSLNRIQPNGKKEMVPLRLVETVTTMGYTPSPAWPEN